MTKTIRPYIEAFTFYLLLIAINAQLFPHLPAYYTVTPHPFWIGILLFGMRYGVGPALFSGAFSAFLYLGLCWLAVERYLFEDLNFYLLPSLFVIVSAGVGLTVQRLHIKIDSLKRKIFSLKEEIRPLIKEVDTLNKVNKGLEKRIVTQISSLVTLYTGTRNIHLTDPTKIYEPLLTFVAKNLEATEASIYLKHGDQLRLHGQVGWSEENIKERPSVIIGANSIAGLAAQKNAIVSIRELSNSEISMGDKGDALFAGPLRKDENGETVAILAVQMLPILKFNSATMNLFSMLLSWGSHAIGQAYLFADLKARAMLDPEFDLHTSQYLLNRASDEFQRSQKYSLPFTISVIRINEFNQYKTALRKVLLSSLIEIAHRHCRDIDVIAKHPNHEDSIVILHNTVNDDKASEVMKLVEVDMTKTPTPTTLTIGVAGYTPRVKSMSELFNLAHHRAGYPEAENAA